MQSFRDYLQTINEDKKKKVSSTSELKKIIKSRSAKGNKVDFNDLDVSGITDFSYVFENYKYEPLVETWDVSNAKTMDSMFYNCYNFNCDISKWNVSNLQNASSMFNGCENFNQDLSKWNVSKLEKASGMFFGCKSFNSDLSKWNVKKLTDAAGMFRLCSSFNSDLSRWDVSNVLDFQYMFERTKVDPAKIEKWASKINPKVGSVELRLKEKPSWEIKILKDRMEKRDAAERKAQAEYNALDNDSLWPGRKIPRGGRFTGD
jgi:surface protein